MKQGAATAANKSHTAVGDRRRWKGLLTSSPTEKITPGECISTDRCWRHAGGPRTATLPSRPARPAAHVPSAAPAVAEASVWIVWISVPLRVANSDQSFSVAVRCAYPNILPHGSGAIGGLRFSTLRLWIILPPLESER